MFKFVFKLIRRIVVYILFLYSFNLILSPVDFIIPINLYTVVSMVILGFPALLSLILITVLIF